MRTTYSNRQPVNSGSLKIEHTCTISHSNKNCGVLLKDFSPGVCKAAARMIIN